MSAQDTQISIIGYIMGSVLCLGLVVLGSLFALAAVIYPYSAAVVLAMLACLYLLHRWRVPSVDIDVDDELMPHH